MKHDTNPLRKFYSGPGASLAINMFWLGIQWRERDNVMRMARNCKHPESRAGLVKTARDRNWQLVRQIIKARAAMAELRRVTGETA